MNSLSISKTYSDIPFGHRQPKHDGHCAWIHGHNWDIEITFTANELDENGFIIDFGKLDCLKQWIADNLDHACVFCEDDLVAKCLLTDYPKLFHVLWVPDASCEGIALYLMEVFSKIISDETDGRVSVSGIRLHEDRKNRSQVMI